VVIPAFNASRWIQQTLRCAQQQTLREIEILVVDDGSVDDTVEVVTKCAVGDPRVRLLRRENGGVGAARNTGIAAASGEFIAPLDADDLWAPTKLAEQLQCMLRCGKRTGLVYCWSRRIDEDGAHLGSYFPFTVEGEARRAMIVRNIVTNASVPLFRASALRNAGMYLTRDEQSGAQGCEDWDLSIRIAENWHVGLVRRELVGYRQSATCMSSGAGGMARSFQMVIARARQRNPDLPACLFRWATGHFYSYLVAKSYCVGDFRGCLSAARRAIAADPLMACNRHLHALSLKSLLWLACPPVLAARRGLRGRATPARPPAAPTPRATLVARVQQRRWARVLAKR
jgi:glycosyltransferase involved in cell wall biosynthesis